MNWLLRSLVCALCLMPLTAGAQVSKIPHTFQSTAGTGNGTPLSVSGWPTVGVQVVMSATGTVNFEATIDGTNWTAMSCLLSSDGSLSSSTTASGIYQCVSSGYAQIRTPVTANAGTITVTGLVTTASIRGSGSGGVTGWPTTLTTAATTSESTPLKVRGTGGQATSGWNIYQHSNGTPTIKCVVADVEGDCHVVVSLNASKKYQVKDSGGTVIFEVDEAAKYTTFTDERHFRVATCQNASPSATFDLPVANAPGITCEGTSTRMATLDFDTTTAESFADSWTLPASYKGTINVHFRWKAAAIVGSVAWCAQLVRVIDGATSDPALPGVATGNCVSDVVKGTTLQENDATITAVTCTSCVAGDRVNVVLSRDPAAVSTRVDDMLGDAKLITYGRTIR